MFKQLGITGIVLFSFIGVITLAQDKPGTGKKENDKMIEHMKMDSSNHNIHQEMKMEDGKEISSEVIWNKVCPVKGEEVDPESPTVEYKGKLYGFCCPGCDAKFAKNPEKYIKNLSEDGKNFIGKK